MCIGQHPHTECDISKNIVVKSQTDILCELELCYDSQFLKHFDILSLLQQEVIINGQEEDEGEEESRGREKVPHVVIVEEVHVHAGLIHIPGNIIKSFKFNSLEVICLIQERRQA